MNTIQKLGLVLLTIFSAFTNARTLEIERATDRGNGSAQHIASNAIDGDLDWSSRWVAEGTPANLILDLGSIQYVTDIGIAWGKGKERSYQFEVWGRENSNSAWIKVRKSSNSKGNSTNIESYPIKAMDAQYIRIKVRSNSAGNNESIITEAELYNGPSSGRSKKSSKKPAKSNASGVGSGISSKNSYGELPIRRINDDRTSDGSYPPYKAIDGDTDWSSRWSASNGGSAVNLTVDLDEATNVKEVGIAWGKGDSRSYTFEIYARPETSGSWTKIYSNTSTGKSDSIEIYDVKDITAEQIRIKVRKNSIKSADMNITEVKVYGKSELDNIAQFKPAGSVLDSWDWSLWDVRGSNPIIGDTMVFDALASKFVTPKGHGWRHELKIKSKKRVSIQNAYEDFKANVQVNSSAGAKTLITQYYAAGKGTIMKLYVSDFKEKGLKDGIAGNGIFDVYVELVEDDVSGAKTKKSLGTLVSGDAFDFSIVVVNGYLAVNAFGESASSIVTDDALSYMTFGNYLQAQSIKSGKYVKNPKEYGKFYKNAGITTSKLVFRELSYTRTVE